MWQTVPWGSSHHGTFEHYNGALLGGIDIAGPIVFRRNRVIGAYNGLRLKAADCEMLPVAQTTRLTCPFNDGVWIYDNTFSFLRDNPIELEIWATDVRIFANEIHNSHAWFSFDGLGAGPFTSMAIAAGSTLPRPGRGPSTHKPRAHRIPTARAKGSPADFDSQLDRKFDYRNVRWMAVVTRSIS